MATVNGVELFVRRLGDPARPPLVLIHGGPGWDHSYLLPAAQALTDFAHVVLFDLRGCGRSARLRPYGPLNEDDLQPERLADDVAALIRSLGHESADVLGFSYGGRIAMRLLHQNPGTVRRLVLASTTAYTDFRDDLEADPYYPERRAMCPVVEFGQPETHDGELSRAMAYADAPLQVRRLDRLDAWHRILERTRFTSDFNEMYASGRLHPGAPENAAEIVRDWGGPALILHGEHDLGFPVAVARRLHAFVPGSVLAVIPEASHMVHFDDPDAWTSAIGSFLTGDR